VRKLGDNSMQQMMMIMSLRGKFLHCLLGRWREIINNNDNSPIINTITIVIITTLSQGHLP
jgi:hypothetical protein